MQKPIFFVILLLNIAWAFVPAKLLDYIVEKVDSKSKMDFGFVSESLTHEEIMRRGVIRSVANYFYDQSRTSKNKVDLNNMNRYYKDLGNLYFDFYGKKYHIIELNLLLKFELQPYVALVDFDSTTKDLPFAHFDADTLKESNQRVIDAINSIKVALSKKELATARKLSAKVLHTIQDFYSHSNWIEMGKTQINNAIGSRDFDKKLTSHQNEGSICTNNCTLVRVPCSNTLNKLINIIKEVTSTFNKAKCPMEYYKCSGNIIRLDKLVSGYYSNQKLIDGSPISNPGNLMKCNHGGLFDGDSFFKQSIGGINKDSGLYLFSPHAGLHLAAANMAILHTEYFFTKIRKEIGDKEFAKFLKIENKLF